MIPERIWDGSQITEPGIWKDVPISTYHHVPELFDAPSISKSAIKHLLPIYGGSPKAFWGRWKQNPHHVEGKTSDALDFGKCAHCLILGDEVFDDAFAVRPEQWSSYTTKPAQEWRVAVRAAGKTPVTPEDLMRIRRMADDASAYPLVQQGILNGRVERTIAWRDEASGVWLKCRPDVLSDADGVFSDLKTTSSFSEDFLERQAFEAGYWLQGAMTRMVCRHLGIPFETFVLVYVLNDDVPDTTHVELSEHELDRGESVIRWALDTIRQCLDANEWPGARPFQAGERTLQLKPWAKQRIDDFLEAQAA